MNKMIKANFISDGSQTVSSQMTFNLRFNSNFSTEINGEGEDKSVTLRFNGNNILDMDKIYFRLCNFMEELLISEKKK